MDVAKFQEKIFVNARKQTRQDRQADCSENDSFKYTHTADILHNPTSVL